ESRDRSEQHPPGAGKGKLGGTALRCHGISCQEAAERDAGGNQTHLDGRAPERIAGQRVCAPPPVRRRKSDGESPSGNSGSEYGRSRVVDAVAQEPVTTV